MKTYDYVFSLGFSCAMTQALRDVGFQKESLPFDWIGSPSILVSAKTVAADFRGFFERDRLKLWDVRITGGFVQRVYRDEVSHFGFSHEFTNAEPIETHYEAEKAKYDRREERLLMRLAEKKRVLAVFLEISKNPRTSDDELVEARRTLRKRFPGTEFDILYFYEDPACDKAETVSSVEGITVVKADYRQYLNGEIMHTCEGRQIRDYLRANIEVDGALTPEEMQAFARSKRRAFKDSMGRNVVDRWINRKLKSWFFDLENYLVRQRLMPGDRPLWFDGDGK